VSQPSTVLHDVPAGDRAADEDGVAGSDEAVEDARAPVNAITLDEPRLRVTTSDESTHYANAVRLTRPADRHSRRVQAEAHRSCIDPPRHSTLCTNK